MFLQNYFYSYFKIFTRKNKEVTNKLAGKINQLENENKDLVVMVSFYLKYLSMSGKKFVECTTLACDYV